MAEHLVLALDPIREKREFYQNRPDLVDEVIIAGTEKARKVARQTMEEVRSAIKM